MKKIFAMAVLAALTLCTATAQENSIRILLDELAQLNGEDVEYELVSDSMINGFIDQIEAMTATDSGHKLFITEYATISSTTSQGYSQICNILDKYDVSATEELFGIPLINNVRAEGEQQIIFADSEHSLIITEDFDQQHVFIAYTNGNIINFSQTALLMMLNAIGGNLIDNFILTEDVRAETVEFSSRPAKQAKPSNQSSQTNSAIRINRNTQQKSGEVRPKTPAVDKEKSRQVMPKSSPKK
ncbi:MAG: hypothetical protein IKZ37_07230 [Bacteroidaceae bacterium]|nr:hypothetical protein [Bacteroidaceae bacterium]